MRPLLEELVRDQRSALDTLVATENPLLHMAATVQCSACHTSTYLGVHRAQIAGIDLRGLPSFFTTTRDVRFGGHLGGQ